ncbi:MAG TPA: Ca2+-dependent phosphoinositide-specific phospholipase C, partial [Chryseolinea sp.]
MRRLLISIPLICYVLGCSRSDNKQIAMNQIQVVGSHNSYKQAIERPVMQLLLARDSNAIHLDYAHLSLKDQLDLGLRGLEIDVLHDPQGGRYQRPLALQRLKEKGIPSLPYDTAAELSKGGLKVLHVADIDFRSHCLLFENCLQEVKQWSQTHPDHVPIIITINPKDSGSDEPGFVPVLPFTSNVLDSLDQEILKVFSASDLITPDAVQGNHASLREAVTSVGWPTLEVARGKVLFVLDAGPSITEMYLTRSLKGRPMFPNVGKDDPNAAFFIMN